ncbi:MAG: peptidylprolyl isomerase [Bacteroidia bacterium]|nr:peptidylprolyl isomerase [Bacteroidia bacterium]
MNVLKKILIILIVCFASISLKAQPNQIIDEVIAVVGNTPILRSEFDILVSQIDPDVKVTDKLKCEILQDLIIDKMLVHQAEIDSITITDDEVNDRIDNNIRFFERQMNSRANIEKYLGMTVEAYKKQIFPKVKAQMLKEKMMQKVQSEIKITPKEVRDFYATIPKDSLPFISSEVEVAQIVMKPIYSAEAKEFAFEELNILRARILAGESFNRLATIYSEDPGSKTQGGLLPEFGRGDMVPEFERAAFTMKKDSISEIIETKYGYHILKLIDKRGDKVIVRHILIRPKLIDADMELVKLKLDTLLMSLRSGKIKLCNAVKDYSEDEETKQNCGYFTDPNIGSQRIPFDYLEKDMATALVKLKPGQYSEPVIGYSNDGSPFFRIFYLNIETKPHVANLEQDWQRIQSMALEDKRGDVLDLWAEKKRRDTFIFISSGYLFCPWFADWNTK